MTSFVGRCRCQLNDCCRRGLFRYVLAYKWNDSPYCMLIKWRRMSAVAKDHFNLFSSKRAGSWILFYLLFTRMRRQQCQSHGYSNLNQIENRLTPWWWHLLEKASTACPQLSRWLRTVSHSQRAHTCVPDSNVCIYRLLSNSNIHLMECPIFFSHRWMRDRCFDCCVPFTIRSPYILADDFSFSMYRCVVRATLCLHISKTERTGDDDDERTKRTQHTQQISTQSGDCYYFTRLTCASGSLNSHCIRTILHTKNVWIPYGESVAWYVLVPVFVPRSLHTKYDCEQWTHIASTHSQTDRNHESTHKHTSTTNRVQAITTTNNNIRAYQETSSSYYDDSSSSSSTIPWRLRGKMKH